MKGILEYLWNNIIYKMHQMGFKDSKLVFEKVSSFKLMVFFTGAYFAVLSRQLKLIPIS